MNENDASRRAVHAQLRPIAQLMQAGRDVEALQAVDALVAQQPGEPALLLLRARLLWQLRRIDEAATAHRDLLDRRPDDAATWVNYANVLKAAGRLGESAAAYRAAARHAPGLGAAWWGLANLKTVRLDRSDTAAMAAALPAAAEDDRVYLHFALGKAHGDLGERRAAIEHYQAGNAGRRARAPHDAARLRADMARARDVFTREFFAARSGWGAADAAPIFIVGMPRSGSTLVEQILASHSAIEGTEELHVMARIAAGLGTGDPQGGYLDAIATLDAATARRAGERYIAATRPFRRGDRPFFTDKMPSNWVLTGLIRLILPNARIIDVRRHPMACGFALFTEHFSRGANFSYDLADIGGFYREYVGLMAHFDAVAPGAVHRVVYEALVDDLEGETRRMLDYLGLPFDAACLRFHETDRAVFTPSAAQVRRPLDRDGLDRWTAYAPWLELLRVALGPVLDHYPDAPPAP